MKQEAANPIDAVYVGFENAKFIMYERNAVHDGRPISFAYSRDENYTCYQNNTAITGCYVQWDNSTNPVTGAYEGGPTQATSFDCRVRPWYESSKASTAVWGGAPGAIWSDPYLLVQTGRVGLTAARHLVTKDGAFVGVAGADFELTTLERILKDSGESSVDILTVFVVDSAGRMMACSVTNMFLTCLLPFLTRVLGLICSEHSFHVTNENRNKCISRECGHFYLIALFAGTLIGGWHCGVSRRHFSDVSSEQFSPRD